MLFNIIGQHVKNNNVGQEFVAIFRTTGKNYHEILLQSNYFLTQKATKL